MGTNTTDVATQPPTGGSFKRSERAAAVPLRPAVDICEDGAGITLQADLPGVSKDRLNVRVENQSLVIEGEVQFDLPQGSGSVLCGCSLECVSAQFRPQCRVGNGKDRGPSQGRCLDAAHTEAARASGAEDSDPDSVSTVGAGIMRP
jgi:Hsp20/alpha crystallin family protein